MEQILKHYPKSVSLTELSRRISSDLEKEGFILSKTIWGTSICSDEVNNTFNIFNKLFAGPGAFRFGGISGLPFTGNTGMVAFVGHIPDEGGAFILYGPHIGISKNGAIGEINREEQKNSSTCCGSLIAGLGAIKDGFEPSEPNFTDYQQYKVQELLHSKKDAVLTSDQPIKEVTEIALKESEKQLYNIIEHCQAFLDGQKLFLMGGIVINTDWDQEDFFEVRNTQLIEF